MNQVYSRQQKDRNMVSAAELRDVPFKVWGLIIAIIAPALAAMFFAGGAIKEHEVLRREYSSGFDKIQIILSNINTILDNLVKKVNNNTDKIGQQRFFLLEEGEKLKVRVESLEHSFYSIDLKLQYTNNTLKEIKDTLDKHQQMSQERLNAEKKVTASKR